VDARPGVNKPQYGYNADDRESASVAHIYGQNIAAAESMTVAAAPWGWSPATLKPTADQELLNGINRFVITNRHHQRWLASTWADTGAFGQWFNRNETWAEQLHPGSNYLARSSYMLQQGRFGADLVYFYGRLPTDAIFQRSAPEIPAGLDSINQRRTHLSTSWRGEWQDCDQSGMQYKVAGNLQSPHVASVCERSIRWWKWHRGTGPSYRRSQLGG